MIETIYGEAHIVARTAEGDYLVSLPKKNMTKTHPNYRGGPCVLWITNKKELSLDA